MSIPSQRKYDKIHALNVQRYGKKIKTYYRKLINEVSGLTYNLSLNPNDEFYFRNNPKVSKKVDDLIKQLNYDVRGITVDGINTEWGLAVNKNNELAIYAAGDKLAELPDTYKEKWFTNNDKARKAFLARKNKGLGLSDKIWKNSKQVKYELELALDVGIKDGRSAANLSREVRGYLNDPNKLFRKVKDDKGVLRLSKAAKAYHPGAGKYRSSYKNALRLTSNETNFSYNASDFEKRKGQDFIVGVRIKTSPGYTRSVDKGGIVCGDLQGDYPKGFDFTYKWHVNCRCISLNILKTKDELDNDANRILTGKEPLKRSKNLVNKKPANYTGYIKDNKKKWSNWQNQPRTFENN